MSSRVFIFKSYYHSRGWGRVAHAVQRLEVPITKSSDILKNNRSTYGSIRQFGSSSPAASSFNINPVDWWKNSQERQAQKDYEKRVEAMAATDSWTLDDMSKELENTVKSWKAKIPGMGSNGELQLARKMYSAVQGLIAAKGAECTAQDLEDMSKLEKLKAINKAEVSIEDLNLFLQQFDTISLMQRVLRKRKLEGKALPMTVENTQLIVQREAITVMTRKQKSAMRKSQEKRMGKASRR